MAMEAYGQPRNSHSAMALTVGLPVAMTAKMILNGMCLPPVIHALCHCPVLPCPAVVHTALPCPALPWCTLPYRVPEAEGSGATSDRQHLPTHLGRAERDVQGLGHLD